VAATNINTGVKYTSETGASGEYRLNNIPVGTYDLSAAAPGFIIARVAGIELQLNHTSAINLILGLTQQ